MTQNSATSTSTARVSRVIDVPVLGGPVEMVSPYTPRGVMMTWGAWPSMQDPRYLSSPMVDERGTYRAMGVSTALIALKVQVVAAGVLALGAGIAIGYAIGKGKR